MQTTLAQFNENASEDRFALQNTEMLRIRLDEGPVHVRRSAIVARQGPVSFDTADHSGVDLVVAEGSGGLFLGECGRNVHLVKLEDGESITAGGDHLLAFTSELACAVTPVDGASGVVNARIAGTGWVALTSDGAPVLLAVGDRGTVAVARAAIAWSEQVVAGAASDGVSGDPALTFEGQGWVLVQPSGG